MKARRGAFELAGTQTRPGEQSTVELPIPDLSLQMPVGLTTHVHHGRRDGPVLLVSAAIHGDELNGIEIIRRLRASRALRGLRGTLLAVPVVNPYGLIHQSRYLPDRRDLNRCFPGSERGSLAGRLAALFLEQVVARCSHAIDLHTAAVHRANLPQVRANLADERAREMAMSFGVPVVLDASLRDGSLRAAADQLGIPILLYEAGEALRFDEVSIRAGLAGVVNVMRSLDMLPPSTRRRSRAEPFVASNSRWVRAPASGLMRGLVPLGASVETGETLAHIADPHSGVREPVASTTSGVVIGRQETPLIHEGDALFHIATFGDEHDDVADGVEAFQTGYSDDL